MTNDLEKTLRELPAGCRDVVARLRASAEVSPRVVAVGRWRPVPLATAAALAAALSSHYTGKPAVISEEFLIFFLRFCHFLAKLQRKIYYVNQQGRKKGHARNVTLAELC